MFMKLGNLSKMTCLADRSGLSVGLPITSQLSLATLLPPGALSFCVFICESLKHSCELLQLQGRSPWHVHYCCQLSHDCCGNITQVPFGFALSYQRKITAAFIPLSHWLLRDWTLALKCEKCRWLFASYSPWEFLTRSNPVLGTW